jgi:hypothetical protein
MRGDMSSATEFCGAAISLALSTGNTKRHSHGLCNLAWMKWTFGDYSTAQVHAIEAQRLAIISADLYREAMALRVEATCCYTTDPDRLQFEVIDESQSRSVLEAEPMWI